MSKTIVPGGVIPPRLERFFETAKERQIIYIQKTLGMRRPWTMDSQFNTWFFCNVFRQLDKVTVWIKENIIDAYPDEQDLWAKIILARRLSRIESMEAVRKVGGYIDFERGKKALEYMKAVGLPIITNAFIMGIPDPSLGDNKLDYMFNLIDYYREQGIEAFLETKPNIEKTTKWLRRAPNMAGFLSYEVASDFTYSRYLKDANDRYSWANPGPGAKRGLSVIRTGFPDMEKMNDDDAIELMEMIFLVWKDYIKEHLDDWMAEACRRVGTLNSDFAKSAMSMFNRLTIREVEHWLCEFDKHERIGRNKRRY